MCLLMRFLFKVSRLYGPRSRYEPLPDLAGLRGRRMLDVSPLTLVDSSQSLRAKGIMKHLSSHTFRFATPQRVGHFVLRQDGDPQW
jgi:hypothetical protein